MDKKTLIFIEDGSFTYDNRVIREADTLVRSGWDVTVISPKYNHDPFYKKINNNLRAYYYPKPTTKSMLGHLTETLVSLIFGSVLTLWVYIKHGFSLFHACNPMDILWIIALPYKVLGKKFLYDHHDLCPELYFSRNSSERKYHLLYKILIILEKYSYKFADVVISTNDSYSEIALSRGGKDPKDVYVVRNGPDLNKFKLLPPKKGLKKSGDVLIGYLGNMNPQDGVEYLINAAAEIVKKRGLANFKFIIIGGGSSKPQLLKKSKVLCLENNVKFTGLLFGNDMISTLSACDICVQPDPLNQLNDKSTMNKALEYMALGKPVIAFDLRETRVSCGNAAIYVKPNDIVDLADKIVFLSGKKELILSMGRIGRARVENKFSWKYSIPHLLSAYNHVKKRN